MNRKSKALTILQSYQNGNYHYLGEGIEGIVFTDGIKVYKIYDSALPETKLIYLEASRNLLHNAVHLYEIEDNEHIKYENNFDLNNKSVTFVREDLFTNLIKEPAWQWVELFYNRLLTNPNVDLTGEDEENLIRYIELSMVGNLSIPNDSRREYQSVDSWKRDYFNVEYRNYVNRRNALQESFWRSWNINPDNSLFDSESILNRLSLANITSNDTIQYNGSNREIIFYKDIILKIKDIYLRIKEQGNLSEDVNTILGNDFLFFKEGLIALINNEKLDFENAKKEYMASLERIDEEFKQIIKNNLNSISIKNSNSNENFNYFYLPKDNYNEYGYYIIFKEIQYQDEVRYFLEIGQDIALIGIYDKYIYTCENGRLFFYEPFTLNEEKEIIYSIDSNNNEKVLFSISHEGKVIIITKTIRNQNYNLRSISIERGRVTFNRVREKLFGNINNVPQSFNAPFYTVYINNDTFYINSLKAKVNEGLAVDNGSTFLYRETITGAGIIIRR
jgi:hypothetical protein